MSKRNNRDRRSNRGSNRLNKVDFSQIDDLQKKIQTNTLVKKTNDPTIEDHISIDGQKAIIDEKVMKENTPENKKDSPNDLTKLKEYEEDEITEFDKEKVELITNLNSLKGEIDDLTIKTEQVPNKLKLYVDSLKNEIKLLTTKTDTQELYVLKIEKQLELSTKKNKLYLKTIIQTKKENMNTLKLVKMTMDSKKLLEDCFRKQCEIAEIKYDDL